MDTQPLCWERLVSLTAGGKLEGQDAALMKVELVLLWLCHVEDLNIAAFHPDRQPLASGAVTQGEDLGTEWDQRQGAEPTYLKETRGARAVRAPMFRTVAL